LVLWISWIIVKFRQLRYFSDSKSSILGVWARASV
jgi:hypothetical protein